MLIAMLPQILAVLMVTLWGLTVLLGLLGKRRHAVLLGALTVIVAVAPFMPRLFHYIFDSQGFITQYGGAATTEVVLSGVFLLLALAALVTTPLVARLAWGWMVPALAALPTTLLYVWLAFWFQITF